MDDHARGCDGRQYTCTCGYDEHIAAALTAAQAREAANKAKIRELGLEVEAARQLSEHQAVRIAELERETELLTEKRLFFKRQWDQEREQCAKARSAREGAQSEITELRARLAEAYERAAQVAEQACIPCDLGGSLIPDAYTAETIAAAIRNLKGTAYD